MDSRFTLDGSSRLDVQPAAGSSTAACDFAFLQAYAAIEGFLNQRQTAADAGPYQNMRTA
jgi:hypothetical protein